MLTGEEGPDIPLALGFVPDRFCASEKVDLQNKKLFLFFGIEDNRTVTAQPGRRERTGLSKSVFKNALKYPWLVTLLAIQVIFLALGNTFLRFVWLKRWFCKSNPRPRQTGNVRAH